MSSRIEFCVVRHLMIGSSNFHWARRVLFVCFCIMLISTLLYKRPTMVLTSTQNLIKSSYIDKHSIHIVKISFSNLRSWSCNLLRWTMHNIKLSINRWILKLIYFSLQMGLASTSKHTLPWDGAIRNGYTFFVNEGIVTFIWKRLDTYHT